MSKIKAARYGDGGPAFPQALNVEREFIGSDGMSLRDYFAGQALVGFLADSSQRAIDAELKADPRSAAMIQDDAARASIVNEQLALGCYRLADAMLTERDKGGGA